MPPHVRRAVQALISILLGGAYVVFDAAAYCGVALHAELLGVVAQCALFGTNHSLLLIVVVVVICVSLSCVFSFCLSSLSCLSCLSSAAAAQYDSHGNGIGQIIHTAGQRTSLENLAPHGVGLLNPRSNLQTVNLRHEIDVLAEDALHVLRGGFVYGVQPLAFSLEDLADVSVLAWVEYVEGAVFEGALEYVEAQALGEGRVDAQGLLGHFLDFDLILDFGIF